MTEPHWTVHKSRAGTARERRMYEMQITEADTRLLPKYLSPMWLKLAEVLRGDAWWPTEIAWDVLFCSVRPDSGYISLAPAMFSRRESAHPFWVAVRCPLLEHEYAALPEPETEFDRAYEVLLQRWAKLIRDSLSERGTADAIRVLRADEPTRIYLLDADDTDTMIELATVEGQ